MRKDNGLKPGILEVRTATEVTSMRAFLDPHVDWLQEVLQCSLSGALIVQADLPLEHLFVSSILTDVPLQSPLRFVGIAAAPTLVRWQLPPDHTPRVQLDPVHRVESDGWDLRWLAVWRETPVALWFAGLTNAVVAMHVPHISHVSHRGPSDQTTRWLLVNRAEAAAALRVLGASLQDARKRLHVIEGEDIYLPEGSYAWDRVMLDPVTTRLVREDFELFLQRREWFREHDLPYRRGYLFYGPPGNGKTSAIRVMAAHPLITPLTVDLGGEDTYNSSISRLFQQAAEHTPALVIFEDLDRVFHSEGSPEKQRNVTLQHLLNCLDGVGNQEGILVVATANDPAGLDPAILRRPGRFDRVVEFRNPDFEQRRAYFTRYVGPALSEETLTLCARRTADFSFAQLREAYILAGQAAFTDGGAITQVELLAGIGQVRESLTGLSQYRFRRAVGFERCSVQEAEPAR